MKIIQQQFSNTSGWKTTRAGAHEAASSQLVLAFGSRDEISSPVHFQTIRERYPQAELVLCSTAGEISGTTVSDDTISLTALCFEKSVVKSKACFIRHISESYDCGKRLAKAINGENLRSVLVISDGHNVNGSDLVRGLQECLPQGTIITGGLAADGGRFEKTIVGLNEIPIEGRVAIIALYGSALTVTYGSLGGWDPFGPERLITRSEGNVLYELDGKPALDIYKTYLGEYASELPGSALLFPLSIRTHTHEGSLVRTILSIDEKEKSLTFAGNMPGGSYARLMKANLDRLIDGASRAAQDSLHNGILQQPDFALLISCIGRKLVLDQRVEEEVEVVRAVYGDQTAIAGFYSYGEISPSFSFMKCELHNQTMTITTLSER